MRKALIIFGLLLAGPIGMYGQGNAVTVRSTTFTATGSGTAISTTSVKRHALTWWGAGTVSTCTMKLEQSSDGTTWTDLIAATSCTTNGTTVAPGAVIVNFVRLTVTTLTGGGSITLLYEGYSPLQVAAVPPGPNGTVGWVNVKDPKYGALGDGQEVVDAVIAATSIVTSATANFITNAKVGQMVWGIEDATGLARLPQGTIVSIQSQTQITVSTTGAGSFSSIRLRWISDDTAALLAARAAVIATGVRSVGLGTLYIPTGRYGCNKAVATSCLDFVTGGPYNSLTVAGDGPNSSVIWTTPGITMNADLSGNMLAILGHDFTVENMGFDGGRFTSGVSNKVAVSTASGTVGTLTDSTPNLLFNVHISQWQTVAGGTDCGLYAGAARTVVLNSAIEQNNCGGYIAGGNFSSIESLWSNNNNGFNLKIEGVADYPTGGASIIRSTVDECGTFATGCLQILSTSDVVISDSVLYGATGVIAVRVDGTSRATISNSRVTPYSADNNGTGLSILAGGIVSATNTKFRSSGTGVAINNAGTFTDGCGNTIDIASGTGGITNTGTLKNCASQPVGGSCFLTSAAGPLACGNAGQGKVAIPTTTTTYTVNTTAIEDTSTIHLTATTANNGIPGAPACVLPAITSEPQISAQVAKTSFTIGEASTAGITCYNWWVTTP